MGIGHCIVEATENCPAAYRCIDCMYLCSTRSDIPEMVQMIKHLNSNLEALKEQGDSQEVEREIALTKKRIQRLTDKISALNIPDVPKKADKKTGDDDILSFI